MQGLDFLAGIAEQLVSEMIERLRVSRESLSVRARLFELVGDLIDPGLRAGFVTRAPGDVAARNGC